MTARTPGERIDLARERLNWSKTKLAEEVGSDQPTISRIISGDLRGRELLPRLAKVLGVPLEWLTVGSSPPEWARTAPPPPPAHGKIVMGEDGKPLTTASAGSRLTPTELVRRVKTLEKLVAMKDERISALEKKDAEDAVLIEELRAALNQLGGEDRVGEQTPPQGQPGSGADAPSAR